MSTSTAFGDWPVTDRCTRRANLLDSRSMARARFLPITAWSAVCALGRSTREVLESLDASRSGLRPPSFDVPVETVVGMVPGELDPLPARYAKYDCRHARMAMPAFEEVRGAVERAVARFGGDRVAVILGTSTGGLTATERAYFAFRHDTRIPDDYDFHHQHDFDALAECLALMVGASGPAYTISTACSSSGKVFSAARRLIDAGLIDAALVGGVDSLCRMTLQGFHGLGVLSAKPCKPFSAERNGINIGEAAAFALVEREGDAEVFLLGVGESSDAHHMSSPHPEGRGASEAMRFAMEQAGIGASDVDHINAHGTSTLLNDQAEAVAIHALFGDRVPVASTKGYTGHTLGAAGGLEAVFAIHAVTSGRIPANLGCDPLDPAMKIDIVRARRDQRVRRVLSSSFAFGGNNVAVLLGEKP
jgi:3-oxoacyl-[acyl-carrier-protein] synthase-1